MVSTRLMKPAMVTGKPESAMVLSIIAGKAVPPYTDGTDWNAHAPRQDGQGEGEGQKAVLFHKGPFSPPESVRSAHHGARDVFQARHMRGALAARDLPGLSFLAREPKIYLRGRRHGIRMDAGGALSSRTETRRSPGLALSPHGAPCAYKATGGTTAQAGGHNRPGASSTHAVSQAITRAADGPLVPR